MGEKNVSLDRVCGAVLLGDYMSNWMNEKTLATEYRKSILDFFQKHGFNAER